MTVILSSSLCDSVSPVLAEPHSMWGIACEQFGVGDSLLELEEDAIVVDTKPGEGLGGEAVVPLAKSVGVRYHSDGSVGEVIERSGPVHPMKMNSGGGSAAPEQRIMVMKDGRQGILQIRGQEDDDRTTFYEVEITFRTKDGPLKDEDFVTKEALDAMQRAYTEWHASQRKDLPAQVAKLDDLDVGFDEGVITTFEHIEAGVTIERSVIDRGRVTIHRVTWAGAKTVLFRREGRIISVQYQEGGAQMGVQALAEKNAETLSIGYDFDCVPFVKVDGKHDQLPLNQAGARLVVVQHDSAGQAQKALIFHRQTISMTNLVETSHSIPLAIDDTEEGFESHLEVGVRLNTDNLFQYGYFEKNAEEALVLTLYGPHGPRDSSQVSGLVSFTYFDVDEQRVINKNPGWVIFGRFIANEYFELVDNPNDPGLSFVVDMSEQKIVGVYNYNGGERITIRPVTERDLQRIEYLWIGEDCYCLIEGGGLSWTSVPDNEWAKLYY